MIKDTAINNELIILYMKNPPLALGGIFLLAESFCDSLKFISYLNVLGTGFLTGTALYALASVLPAEPHLLPVDLILGELVILVERVNIH